MSTSVRIPPPFGSSSPLRALVFALAAGVFATAVQAEPIGGNPAIARRAASGDVAGSVTDSTNDRPLQGVEIAVQQTTRIIANTTTDAFGRYTIHNIPAGAYTVTAHFIGYRSKGVNITVTNGAVHASFKLFPAPASLEAVEVTAQAPVAINTTTGDQTYSENEAIHPPSATTSSVIQQSIAGAARAPTGEVHIRGQHAEYTYYVDGVPVPPGISGSLNELFSPEVAQAIDFQTGGWDAEYGGRQSAIINIETRIPSGPFHSEVSLAGGSYGTNATSLTMSGNSGRLGMFFSGQANGTNMRLDPVVAAGNDPGASGECCAPVNYHNAGSDYYGFGKLQYSAGPRDLFTMDGSYSTTHFDVPYDSAVATLNDHQTDVNSFVNFAYHHRFGEAVGTDEQSQPAELFVGPYFRDGSLDYRPGSDDVPSFVDANDPTKTPRDVFESRNFYDLGIKTDLSFPLITGLMDGKVGTIYQRTYGHEDFALTDPTGAQEPIASNSGLNGYDWGSYAQVNIRPIEWFELRTGLRFDTHVEPFASNQTQVSPRIRLNFFPSPANTFYLYFGRVVHADEYRGFAGHHVVSARRRSDGRPNAPGARRVLRGGISPPVPLGDRDQARLFPQGEYAGDRRQYDPGNGDPDRRQHQPHLGDRDRRGD